MIFPHPPLKQHLQHLFRLCVPLKKILGPAAPSFKTSRALQEHSCYVSRPFKNPSFRPMSTSTSPLGGATITGPDGHVLHLPPSEAAVGPYRKFIIDAPTNMLYTSTHFGTDGDNKIVKGRVGVGSDELVQPEQAKVFARNAGLRLLATIHAAVGGDLSRVEQVLKLTGFVNGR